MNRSEVQSKLLSLGGEKTDAFTNSVFGLGINDADTAEQLLLMATVLSDKGYVGPNYLRTVKEWAASLKAPVPTPATPAPSKAVEPTLYAASNQALDHGHQRLGTTPQGVWVNGWGDMDRAREVAQKAKAAGQVPHLVAYYAENRDNGQYSAGGAASSQDYRNWGRALADAIRGSNAIVVLEPDALTLYNGTPSTRYADLGYVGKLLLEAGAKVFLSAGHSRWLPADEVANRGRQVGFGNFTGFSFNDSNYRPLAEQVVFAEQVWAMTNKAYVIDTSRNGAGKAPLIEDGSERAWCNQPSRTFGELPTLKPSQGEHCYAYLWTKHAGESDGAWNPYKGDHSAPGAGQWFEEYVQEMERNSGW
jgi:endoglucanase